MNKIIGKKDFISNWKDQANLSEKEAIKYYDAIVESLKTFAFDGNKVSIPELGMFWVANQKAKKSINLSTKEPMIIPAKKVLKYKMSKNLKVKVA